MGFVVERKNIAVLWHFRPLHTELEMQLMNAAVEVSFNNIVQKFTHSDYFAMHWILQQGQSNWPNLRCLWDLQVLFNNLFGCAQGHGNPCNAILGVAPPTVSDYLYSANHNLPISLTKVKEEDDNFRDEEEAQRMYYHLIFLTNILIKFQLILLLLAIIISKCCSSRAIIISYYY